MKPIPQNILAGFNDLLKQRNVPPMLLGDYRKWLLYFLDFRTKYPLPDSPSDQVRLFADKLRSKHQTAGQVKQATDALSLFFASRPGSKINPSLVTGGARVFPGSFSMINWRRSIRGPRRSLSGNGFYRRSH